LTGWLAAAAGVRDENGESQFSRSDFSSKPSLMKVAISVEPTDPVACLLQWMVVGFCVVWVRNRAGCIWVILVGEDWHSPREIEENANEKTMGFCLSRLEGSSRESSR
jgi:hypothetical protein